MGTIIGCKIAVEPLLGNRCRLDFGYAWQALDSV